MRLLLGAGTAVVIGLTVAARGSDDVDKANEELGKCQQ